MTFLLARAGCETAVATTGKKAVQMAEEVRFDLITLDVDLPDGNGFILCSRLKEQAHELATQWLAAVDVNVPALEKKYPPEVNRLRVLPKNSTNIVEAPFYFVHWGWQYFTNNDDNHTISSTPLVEVKILGTTKEFVELHMLDTSFSRRPLLLVTNALELIRTPNPSVKHLQPNPTQNNSVDDTNAPVARPSTF